MNKTHHELCDENIQLREQLDAAQASTNLARLATRHAIAKAEELEREHDALAAHVEQLSECISCGNEMLGELRKQWQTKMPKSARDVQDQIDHGEILKLLLPDASLARLIAEKQAEALEQTANDLYDKLGLSREQINFLAVRAEQLQRQAAGEAV